MNRFKQLSVLTLIVIFAVAGARISIAAQAPTQTSSTNSLAKIAAETVEPKSTIWQNGIGEGFLPCVQDFSIEAGIAPGMATFGSRQAHNLALLSLSYGHMLGHVMGEGHWYRGNFEGRLELFGGAQFRPDVDADGWLVGLTPHLRYNFATGTRWIPFLDGGAGVTATGIGQPDLSGTFEFNLQASTGVRWFLRDDFALTGEVRYMHLSCAGIHQPNLGINNVGFFVGVTWFFGK
jgi:hypothetical protein